MNHCWLNMRSFSFFFKISNEIIHLTFLLPSFLFTMDRMKYIFMTRKVTSWAQERSSHGLEQPLRRVRRDT